MKTFHHGYKLKKDTPTHKTGWPLRWSGRERKFFFSKESTWGYNKGEPDIFLDYEGASYTVEQVQDREWFEPDSREVPFIPAFPSKTKIEEYVDLLPNCRLIEDVDECRAINMLLSDKTFQERLYNFYKKQYESFHSL